MQIRGTWMTPVLALGLMAACVTEEDAGMWEDEAALGQSSTSEGRVPGVAQSVSGDVGRQGQAPEEEGTLEAEPELLADQVAASRTERPTVGRSWDERQACEPGDLTCCPYGPCPDPHEVSTEITGYIDPKFAVLSVIYAPPAGAPGYPNWVKYSTGSTTGLVHSTARSFNKNSTYSASVSIAGFEPTISSGWNTTLTQYNELAVTKSSSKTITVNQPNSNGILHDYDMFVVWLNPELGYKVNGSKVTWTTAVNTKLHTGKVMDIMYYFVRDLKNGCPSLLQTDEFKAHMLSAADCSLILARNPQWNAAPPLGTGKYDLPRYVPTNETVPYVAAPYGGNPPCTDATDTLSTTVSVGSQYEESFSVGYSSGGSVSFGSWLSANTLSSTSYTWTHSNRHTESSGKQEAAAYNICGPGYGWTGPQNLLVYFDTLYKTFAFQFVSSTASLVATGRLMDASGAALVSHPVVLTVDGVEHRTWTDGNGEYRFYDLPVGPATLNVDGILEEIILDEEPAERNFVSL